MIPPRMPPEELELDEAALHHATTSPTRAEDGFVPRGPPPRRNGGRVVLVLALLLLLIGGGVGTALLLASSRVTRFLESARRAQEIPAARVAPDPREEGNRGRKVVYTPTLAAGEPEDGVQGGTREETPMLFVDSTPSGAIVFADGLELGPTPLAVETPYPEGEIFTVEVRAPGKAPWSARLAGGRSHLLSAQLERK